MGNPFKVEKLDPVEQECPKHGKYMASRIYLSVYNEDPIIQRCPLCEKEREEREKRTDDIVFARAIGIPERFVQCDYDSYDVGDSPGLARIKGIVLRFIRSTKRGRCLIISGSSNTGKTHLACMALKLLNETSSMYTNIVGILDNIKRSYNHKRGWNEERTETIQTRFNSIDFLVIDNFEQFQNTADNRKLLFSLVNERYNRNKSTIVCTTQNKEEMKKITGEGLFNKLQSNGMFLEL